MWLELIRKGIYHEGTKGTKKAGDRLLGKPATHDLAERVARWNCNWKSSVMDSLESRIERLENLIGHRDNWLSRIPPSWAETDPFSGEPTGPPDNATQAELRTWQSVLPIKELIERVGEA